jgi:four helix bundle protein
VYSCTVRDVTKIAVWHKARAVAVAAYEVTEALPPAERYGLQSQIRRAAVSIVANIAEGCATGSPGNLERHLRIAAGSAGELETLLIVSHDLGLLDPSTVLRDGVAEVRKMLNGFATTVNRNRRKSVRSKD